jgi:hypothetical protein
MLFPPDHDTGQLWVQNSMQQSFSDSGVPDLGISQILKQTGLGVKLVNHGPSLVLASEIVRNRQSCIDFCDSIRLKTMSIL